MAAIAYKQFPEYLESIRAGDRPPEPVYLVHGEEYLCKRTYSQLLDFLLPGADRNLNCEIVDSIAGGIADAIQRASTFSLMPGRKVIAVLDSQLFHAKQDVPKILELTKKALDDDNLKKGCGHFLNLLALLGLGLADMEKGGEGRQSVKEAYSGMDEDTLDAIVQYCRDRNLAVPQSTDSGRLMQEAVERGFPKDNILVITTDIVDRRKALYKAFESRGLIIDCSVPKGERLADKTAQEAVMFETLDEMLRQSGKAADRDVRRAMADLTGFDLRTFTQNLEKLVTYVGDREAITLDDVQAVLKRTKKDPIYEFTNALMEKRLDRALFFMDSLLDDPDMGHPLQLLGAVVNQVRKLIVVRGFLDDDAGKTWYDRCAYPHFQNAVMPAVQRCDQELKAQLERWETALAAADGPDPSQSEPDASGKPNKPNKPKKPSKPNKPKLPATDLIIAANPRNAYPIFQSFRKAALFSTQELVSIMGELSREDQRLKTTGLDGKRILERIVFTICGKG